MEIFCPNCFSVIESDDEFCPYCNELINAETELRESKKNICPVCGKENDIQAKKCDNCCSII